MTGLWLIPVVLGIWLVASLALALLIGPVLRRSSERLERHDSLDMDVHNARRHHVTVTDHRG